jgi:hypothetical protein
MALLLGTDDPLAVAVAEAIRAGEVATLQRLLDEHRGLAAARVWEARMSRTLLHVATDWPGHFPNGRRDGRDPGLRRGRRERPLLGRAHRDAPALGGEQR